MHRNSFRNFLKTGAFLSALLIFSFVFQAHAQTANVDDLKEKIEDHNAAIEKLNQEIQKYQTELNKTSAQAKTLQNTVKTLNITQNKLGADIKVTQNKIGATQLTIAELEKAIREKEKQIAENKLAVGESLRNVQNSENQSLIESLLSSGNLSSFWDDVETSARFQDGVRKGTLELRQLETDLIENKTANETQKKQLLGFKDNLSDQKKVVDQTTKEKNQLLTQTKSQESTYQQLLADRKAKKEAFEKELLQFESQLKLAVDPNSIPKFGSGILSPPLAKILVTQQFGDTEFSRTHAGVYNGNGHNGVDFAAPIGTPVMAALEGVIKGSGDTDSVCYKASYGKWVLIEHPNGLSTLYAHLSVIKASAGQQVKTGDIIGYSGNTGYTTGPHLHFTLYATQGVRIMQRQSAVCGGAYTMPIADLKAYLNPMLYL